MISNENNNIKQMNLIQIILYHLLPGIPVFLLAGAFAFGAGISMTYSFILALIFGLIPVQLLIIHITAKRQGARFKDMIPFVEKLPLIKIILWALPCIAVMWLAFWYFRGIEHSLWNNLLGGGSAVDAYLEEVTRNDVLWRTIVLTFMFNGFAAPIVEEIYFRGFLLPRMNKLGKSAPAVNIILFSISHFFSPMEILTRILGLLPLAYTVWLKKNIYIGMVTHCAVNLAAMTFAFFVF
jgi:membrane protease YdiL (CAAX protease family)